MKTAKLAYRPLGLAFGFAGGIAARAAFNQVWKWAGHDDDAPDAMDEERTWREILLAAALQGAVFAVVKAAVDRGAVLCAVRDGEIAGIAAYGEREGLMHLTQLHVLPARWRAGIGAELHAACVEKWRAAGVTTVRLDVFDKNERAQAFYTAQGWTPDPQTPRHGDHLVLRLTLAAETE